MIGQSQIQILEDLKKSSIRWIASHGLGLPEAEDVFQQAILKVLSSPASNEEPEKITAWFYQILRNTLTDEFRKTQSDRKKADEYALEVLPKLDPETEKNLCRCVQDLLSELPPMEKEILEGHFFEGKKFKELTARFNQTEGAIRVKAQRAREKLKESLKACCNMTRFDQAEECGC